MIHAMDSHLPEAFKPPTPHGDRPPTPYGDRPPTPHGDSPPAPHGDIPPTPHGDVDAVANTERLYPTPLPSMGAVVERAVVGEGGCSPAATLPHQAPSSTPTIGPPERSNKKISLAHPHSVEWGADEEARLAEAVAR